MRASLAGQTALDAKKRSIAAGWGDVQLGPVKLDLQAQMSIEASDNVRYRADDTEEDLILRPGVSARALWPISDRNTLSLGAGIAYNKYVSNSDLDYLLITPGSDIGYDIYVGDFVINFHDRFHYTQDVASQAEVSGRGSFGRFDNNLGTLVKWDLNEAILLFNYDHEIYFVTESLYDYVDHTSELFSLRSAWLVTPVTPLGAEFGFGIHDYDQDRGPGTFSMDDLMHYSVGLFYEMPAGRVTSFRLAAGYVLYDPTTHVNTNAPDASTDSVYADLSLNQRLTQHIQYTLSLGNQIRAGLNAQTVRILYTRASIQWAIIRGFGLQTTFGYENGKESGGLRLEENFDRYSATVTLSKRLNDKLTTSLGYGFWDRTSDIPSRDYTQNRLVFSVSYTF